MAKNTKRAKTTKSIIFPNVVDTSNLKGQLKPLPYDSSNLNEERLRFSFQRFDRNHDHFNLGDNSQSDKTVSSGWFLDMLDCLKEVSQKTFQELKQGKRFQLHPVKWEQANIPIPEDAKQAEYWQFRINKGRGRVIGIYDTKVFYIVWFDPHHNLTTSEHYGGVSWHPKPKSEYEQLLGKNEVLQEERNRLKEEIRAYEELLNEYAK